MDTLGEGAESRNVGGIAERKTTERLVVGSTNKKVARATHGGEKVRENSGGKEGKGERENEKSGDHVQK